LVVVALKENQVLKPRINHLHRLSILIGLVLEEYKVQFKVQIMDQLHSKKDHLQVMESDQETMQITMLQIIEPNHKSLILT
jgi:hypothetical protein